jgi:hypothetical protein
VHRGGWTGEIEDLIDLDIERERNVVAHQLEMRVIEHGEDVVFAAGEVIVDAQDVVTVSQQPLAQVRAEEAGATGYQNAFPCQTHVGDSQVSGRSIEPVGGGTDGLDFNRPRRSPLIIVFA